ncbi:hypothetical protein [Paraglaciecola sp. L3A3]|uniref:hypothetical protein n=1 Tax=Paraglaciecola sp. L3A3 TaxID=2686358 RepID=UPI00131C7697|nr:hypothetical protein [Paraglaciecola sp. L3A3]
MWQNYLLYGVFLGQIFVLSVYFPRKILGLIDTTIMQRPSADYPKLYPIDVTVIQGKLKLFALFNCLVVALGLGILAYSIFNTTDDLAGWDDQGVLVSYLMLQYIPMIFLAVQGFIYLNLMRDKNKSIYRSADSTPRKLTDYVPKTLLICALVSYVLCVATIIYFNQYPFDGFAGLVNILGVSVIYVGLGFGIYQKLYGKKYNPLKATNDRKFETTVVLKLLVLSAIFSSLYLTISLILASLDMRDLGNVIYSVYLQIFVFYIYQVMKFDQVDYSVYKA